MNPMRIARAVALLTLFGVGCAHTVQYKLSSQDRWPGPKIDKVLAVGMLADQTTPETERTIKIDAYTWRTNFRDKYKNEEISSGVTAMLAKHLAHSGLFRKVVIGF